MFEGNQMHTTWTQGYDISEHDYNVKFLYDVRYLIPKIIKYLELSWSSQNWIVLIYLHCLLIIIIKKVYIYWTFLCVRST